MSGLIATWADSSSGEQPSPSPSNSYYTVSQVCYNLITNILNSLSQYRIISKYDNK